MGLAPVVGSMPPMGPLIKNADDLWKMLAFIRSRYDDDPAYKSEPLLRSSSRCFSSRCFALVTTMNRDKGTSRDRRVRMQRLCE
jgi:hypothetical protein